MTVYVDTPAGQRSGSSVIEVVSTPPGPMGSSQNDVRGEAVAVDLPDGTLFALLRSPTDRSGAPYYVGRAYAGVLPRGQDWKTDIDMLKRQTYPAPLPMDDMPLLVRFGNPADARTIEVLDPANLSPSFGPRVRLKRIVVQMTDDPVTETIERRLPSFGPGTGFAEWIRSLDFHDPRRLSDVDFRRGF